MDHALPKVLINKVATSTASAILGFSGRSVRRPSHGPWDHPLTRQGLLVSKMSQPWAEALG